MLIKPLVYVSSKEVLRIVLFAAECSEHDNRLSTEQGQNYADDTRVIPGNADIIVLPAGTDTDKEYLENHSTGSVISLGGQTVALTGKISVRGKHVLRPQLVEMLEHAGVTYKDDLSRKVSLRVHGDLSSQHVVNEWEQHSQKLEFVKAEARSGHHICVVTARGFSDLLSGSTAECQLWRYGQALSNPS